MELATIRQVLPELVDQLLEDGELDDMDLAILHDAMVSAANAANAAKDATAAAHVHDVAHRPVITRVPTEGLDEDQWPESVDASGVVCHDCGRELISDAGTTRILVCPRIHGKRPSHLAPTDPDGAVECGRPAV